MKGWKAINENQNREHCDPMLRQVIQTKKREEDHTDSGVVDCETRDDSRLNSLRADCRRRVLHLSTNV